MCKLLKTLHGEHRWRCHPVDATSLMLSRNANTHTHTPALCFVGSVCSLYSIGVCCCWVSMNITFPNPEVHIASKRCRFTHYSEGDSSRFREEFGGLYWFRLLQLIRCVYNPKFVIKAFF